MFINKINFSIIKSQIEAAEAMQEANKEEVAKEILLDLANDIFNNISVSTRLPVSKGKVK